MRFMQLAFGVGDLRRLGGDEDLKGMALLFATRAGKRWSTLR
jgi:hypothetical protein